jgi:AcrR family transcriptional regulator
MKATTRARQTQAERRTHTRSALIRSAERAFSRHGFHAASVEAIAEEAGYSKGAVYGRFGGKDDLFLAVMEERFDRRLVLGDDDGARSGGTGDRLEAMARAHQRAVADDPAWTVAWVEFAAHATRDLDLSRRLRALNRELRQRAMRRMAELDLIDGRDAGYLATVSLVYASGVSVERMLDPDSVSEEDLARMARALARDVEREDERGA